MKYVAILIALLSLTGCETEASQEAKDAKAVDRQQKQYAIGQPVPSFRWSLERHLVIQLYHARNMKAATWSVWRSNTGLIEGDCASIGFGIPYDTSLTNPLKIGAAQTNVGYAILEQSEPNGIFASKNTSATWVMCAGEYGNIEPVYVEAKVTTYPYVVDVNYETNRVTKAGASTVLLDLNKAVNDAVEETLNVKPIQ